MAKKPGSNMRIIGAVLMLIAVVVAVVLPLTIAGNAIIATFAASNGAAYPLNAVSSSDTQVVVFDADYTLSDIQTTVGIGQETATFGDAKIRMIFRDLDAGKSIASVDTTLDARPSLGTAVDLKLSFSSDVKAGTRYGVTVLYLESMTNGTNPVSWYMVETGSSGTGRAMEKEVIGNLGTDSEYVWGDEACLMAAGQPCTPANLRVSGIKTPAGGGATPTAAFSWTSSNLTATFTDLSTPPAANESIQMWTWNFGDGSNGSSEQNPSHAYTAEGTYAVQLIVTSSGGSTDDVTGTIRVALAQAYSGSTVTTVTTDTGIRANFSLLLILFAFIFAAGVYMVSDKTVKKNESRIALGIVAGVGYALIFALVV